MDIEGTIQFIINQQAQFVADIHSLQVRGDKLTADVEKLHDIVKHHEDTHVVTYGMISKLTDVVTDHVERQTWLFDGHKRTEEKLDRLITKMDGFIDEVRRGLTGRNGGAENA